jgi:predicted methyltransferase
MYHQAKLSELIRFARVDARATVIDVYPGDGEWTRIFSDIVGPEGERAALEGHPARCPSQHLRQPRRHRHEPTRADEKAFRRGRPHRPERTMRAPALAMGRKSHEQSTCR